MISVSWAAVSSNYWVSQQKTKREHCILESIDSFCFIFMTLSNVIVGRMKTSRTFQFLEETKQKKHFERKNILQIQWIVAIWHCIAFRCFLCDRRHSPFLFSAPIRCLFDKVPLETENVIFFSVREIHHQNDRLDNKNCYSKWRQNILVYSIW